MRGMRGVAGGLLLAVCGGLFATPAVGSDPATAPGVPAAPRPPEGTFCTPVGCFGPPSASWTKAAAFGGAVLAVVWLGRRTRSEARPG